MSNFVGMEYTIAMSRENLHLNLSFMIITILPTIITSIFIILHCLSVIGVYLPSVGNQECQNYSKYTIRIKVCF